MDRRPCCGFLPPSRRPISVRHLLLLMAGGFFLYYVLSQPVGLPVNRRKTKVEHLNIETSLAWYRVQDRAAWFYSAHYDDRPLQRDSPHRVSVIALVHLNESRPFSCHLWYPTARTSVAVSPIQQKALNPLMSYPTAYTVREWMLICPLESTDDAPAAVCISASEDSSESCTPWLGVQTVRSHSWNLTWCLPALHGPYSNAKALIEAFELARLRGVEHVTVYNYSVSASVDVTLRHYLKQGFVEVMPWALPLPDSEVFYLGQVAAINNCLYRYRGASQLVLFHDLDEVIVTTVNSSDLLRTIASLPDTFRTWYLARRHAATYVIPHAEYAHNNQSLMVDEHWRVKQFDFHRVRSKLIVNPQRTLIVGVHQIMEAVRGADEYWVNNEQLFLAHYRQPLDGNLILDDRLSQYSSSIRATVSSLLQSLAIGS